jgi:hypothetical protein
LDEVNREKQKIFIFFVATDPGVSIRVCPFGTRVSSSAGLFVAQSERKAARLTLEMTSKTRMNRRSTRKGIETGSFDGDGGVNLESLCRKLQDEDRRGAGGAASATLQLASPAPG